MAKASTRATAKNPALEGFRGKEPRHGNNNERAPGPVDDDQTIHPTAPLPHEVQPQAETTLTPEDEGTAPVAFTDKKRNALAQRAAAMRAEKRVHEVSPSHVPAIDGDYIEGETNETIDPGAQAPVDGEGLQGAADDIAAAQTAVLPTPAPQESKPQHFILKVNGNTFQVTGEELLRYAEVDPDEAQAYSAPALVRLAQKQIAASIALDEAKRTRQESRPATPDQRTQQQQPAPQPQPTPRAPSEDVVSLVQEIQYGDPREAAAKTERLIHNLVAQEVQTRTHGDRAGQIDAEYNQDISAWAQQNPDIVQNDVLASSHIAIVAREIADDFRNLGLIDDRKYAAIANNPSLAAQLQRQALIEGVKVRRPAAIIEAATSKLDQAFGRQRQNPPPPPVPNVNGAPPRDRIAEKRTILQPPARQGSIPTPQGQRTTPDDRKAVQVAALNKMRGQRHQPVG